MVHRRRLISASELRTWCYCHKAWHFERLGYPSSLSNERAAGTSYHRSRDQALRAARRIRAIAGAIIVICLAVMIFLTARTVQLP